MLRKCFLGGFAFGFAMMASLSPGPAVPISTAQTLSKQVQQPVFVNRTTNVSTQIWHTMGEDERLIVDRLAADFFERSLRYAQTQSIEATTANLYRYAHPNDRQVIRKMRRDQYAALPNQQQQALRNNKRPQFAHLNEIQKWPFREHAMVQLGAVGAIDERALQNRVRPGI